jgi:(1->4)-alpha-D-glucan 1-alpha-D-glucosylmutase
VDYHRRQQLLADVEESYENDPEGFLREALESTWATGAVKLAVTRAILLQRQRDPDLFNRGDYTPIGADGPAAGHVCAFSRMYQGRVLLIAVSRFSAAIQHTDADETTITLPENIGVWHDLLSKRTMYARIPGRSLSELFRYLPVSVMIAE